MFVKQTIAVNTLLCLEQGCLHCWFRQSKVLIRLLTVLCLAGACRLKASASWVRQGSPLTWTQNSRPLYPLSQIVISWKKWRTCLRPFLKILTSVQLPAQNRPCTQTTFEQPTATKSLYCTPALFSLWEYQLLQKGVGSWIQQSVPSVVVFARQFLAFRSLSFQQIWSKLNTRWVCDVTKSTK